MKIKEPPRAYKSGRPRMNVDIDEIRRLRDLNYSLEQIAQEIGASKSTVARRVRVLAVSSRRENEGKGPTEAADV